MELAIPFDGHVVIEKSITSSQDVVTPSYATPIFSLITFPKLILLHFH
jgi:hypothetical protein